MAGRLAGPLDTNSDSFERATRERLRQGLTAQLRLDPPLGAFLRSAGAVSPLGYCAPLLLPGVQALPMEQCRRGPLGQPLQPVPLWIVNPVKQVLFKVWIGQGAAPAGFTLVPPERTKTVVENYEREKAKQKPPPTPPPQPPAPAKPEEKRQVAFQATLGMEFEAAKKASGEQEKSVEVVGGIEVVFEVYEGTLGSVELTYKPAEVAFKIFHNESGRLEPGLGFGGLNQAIEVSIASPEFEFLGAKWQVSWAAQVYAGTDFSKATIGGNFSVGIERKGDPKKKERSVKFEFIGGRERETESGKGMGPPINTLGAAVTITFGP